MTVLGMLCGHLYASANLTFSRYTYLKYLKQAVFLPKILTHVGLDRFLSNQMHSRMTMSFLLLPPATTISEQNRGSCL